MNSLKKVYDNCEIYSIENELLGYCNKSRLKWYLKKDLAVSIGEDKIRLKFTPKGSNIHLPNLIKKDNLCVNCGTREDLTKHHVIPKCYIKFFPLEIKSNNSHDVVPLCVDCHADYEIEATKIKNKLAEKYSAPLDIKREYTKLFKAYSCLTKLMMYQNNESWIESQMILNMMYTVETYYPEVSYTDHDLKQLRIKVSKVKKITHGKLIMEHITDLQEFAELWRNHFIETMNPIFMPEGWSITNKIYRNNDKR